MKRRVTIESQIPEKANRILGGILVFFLLIVARIWHLAIVQHDEKLEESTRPQMRTIIEKPERASILDRNGNALAINRVQYHASIAYNPIQQVKRVKTVIEEGKKIKKYVRKEYISELSQKLGSILHMNPIEIEDCIYARAAILGNVPYRLKENITEECYFQLKMLENSWPGIVAEVSSKRVYPYNDTAGEIIGYIGPISSHEYNQTLEKLQNLREFGHIKQLEELEKQACSLSDLTGKMGAEASFDRQLRGEKGKKVFLADIKGNYLRALPGGVDAQEGKPLKLTIDIELQKECERLLQEYENESPSLRPVDIKRRSQIPPLRPWIKGGAIIAMDAKTGEILALASHPGFDPNDFIEKKESVNAILETDAALQQIWEFRQPLQHLDRKVEMTWENYLKFILPEESTVVKQLQVFDTINDALFVQENLAELFAHFDAGPRQIMDVVYEEGRSGVQFTIGQRDYFVERFPEVMEKVRHIKENLAPYFDPIELNDEKLLLADLYRLVVQKQSKESLKLADFRLISGHFFQVESALKEIVQTLFQESVFQKWREEHFKSYLVAMRKKEKAEKQKYAKPYTDYLEAKKKQMFEELWEQHKAAWLSIFLGQNGEAPFKRELAQWAKELELGAYPALSWRSSYFHVKKVAHLPQLFDTFVPFNELNDPLWGHYPGLRSQSLKHLATAFYPRYGYGIARSHAFRQATVIGSLFKLVPGYEAMRQHYLAQLEAGKKSFEVNPLTIIDDKHRAFGKGWNVGFTVDGRVIPHYYKGGRLPRSEHSGVGRVEIEKALETSSNPYFSLLASDVMEDPEDLVKAANLFSFGEKTGIALPGEYAGILPRDVTYDRTGLYSMAIGQHSMVGTPLQTAVMLASIANGGKVLRPLIACQEEPEVRWELFMPKEIQRKLINGMKRVVMGEKGTARFVRRSFPDSLCERFVGKTSTAEVIERYGLDKKHGQLQAKEVWFGGILYHDQECTDPDIVIVVYLKQGLFGRLAAPYAFKVAQKWEELARDLHEYSR